MARGLTSLEQHLRRRREDGNLFIPYLTAGIPSPQRFVDVFSAFAKVADAIEVGVPFSDPVMDGPVIQEASSRAIEQGMDLEGTLQLIRECQRHVDLPVILMSYYNPIYAIGEREFASRAKDLHLGGVIVPDLPFEASRDLRDLLAKVKVAQIQLAPPNASAERLAEICATSTGFVYAVTRLSTTGQQLDLADTARPLVKSIKDHTDTPVLLGIGISDPAQAKSAVKEAGADGIIVGSALVKLMLGGDTEAAIKLARSIREALST
jgi:tryptophan synthase alpha chain